MDFDVDLIVRPVLSQELPLWWKPLRNPGSTEDITKGSEYLKHLTYHGGLNTAVWTRRELDDPCQKSEESPLRDAAKELQQVEESLKLGKTDSSCSQETGVTISSLVEAWLENSSILDVGTVKMEETIELVVSTASSDRVSTQTAMEAALEKVDPQLLELPLSDSPNAWIVLLIFLSFVILQRVFLVPTVNGQCNEP